MSYPINIYTTDGKRFDVFPSTSIELVMGGVSLLDLSQRSFSYTNMFTLPPTPQNHLLFGFAGLASGQQITPPAVTLSRGLTNRVGRLVFEEFTPDSGYSCMFASERSTVSELRSINFYTLLEDQRAIREYLSTPSHVEILGDLCNTRYTDGRAFLPVTSSRIPATESGQNISAVTVGSIMSRITELYGYTFAGDMSADNTFLNTFIFNKYLYFDLLDTPTFILRQRIRGVDIEFLSIADVFRELSYLFFFNIRIDGTVIYFESVASLLENVPIRIEGVKWTKQARSGYNAQNFIAYNVEDSENELFGSDVFTADGVGYDIALQMKSFIPLANDDGYITNSDESRKNLIIMASAGQTVNSMTFFEDEFNNVDSYRAEPLSMAGVYSDVIGDIFNPTEIMSVNTHLDSIQITEIEQKRIVSSVQVGGTYWVEDMHVNLSTGNAVLKLIRIR